jgi:hypothetical protein
LKKGHVMGFLPHSTSRALLRVRVCCCSCESLRRLHQQLFGSKGSPGAKLQCCRVALEETSDKRMLISS